jgi:phenylpyruvate tautomerase PptA (4-oxalocrotonate tautomerase family)
LRVQVLTNAGGLNRDMQITVVAALTELIATAPGTRLPPERIWVLLTAAVEGGWGLWGHAHTNADLVDAARSRLGHARRLIDR